MFSVCVSMFESYKQVLVFIYVFIASTTVEYTFSTSLFEIWMVHWEWAVHSQKWACLTILSRKPVDVDSDD